MAAARDSYSFFRSAEALSRDDCQAPASILISCCLRFSAGIILRPRPRSCEANGVVHLGSLKPPSLLKAGMPPITTIRHMAVSSALLTSPMLPYRPRNEQLFSLQLSGCCHRWGSRALVHAHCVKRCLAAARDCHLDSLGKQLLCPFAALAAARVHHRRVQDRNDQTHALHRAVGVDANLKQRYRNTGQIPVNIYNK